jgi:pimeloyl-ACP methyl ester carboxylesterase
MKEYFFENRIYYRTNDFKEGRLTLVFAHGVSGSSSAWWPYEKIFENKYNLLTYDIRGHGMSKKYPRYEDYDIKNFVNDFHDLLIYLKISKFVLLSSSFATLITHEYLKRYRESVLALIFTSTEVYEDDAFMLKVARPFLKIVTSILPILPFNPKPRGHVDYSKTKNSDWSIQRNIADTGNTGLHAQFYTLRHSFLPGQEYELDKINVPTLIIHGEKDSLVPIKNVIAFSRKIKNCEFVNIPNFDHDIHHNAIKELSEAIESFLEKHKDELRVS